MKKYDVIVVGGGFAGVAAAVSAARGGASVLLIEKSNCLGGAAANSLVIPFMRTHDKTPERFDFSRGIFLEIRDLLEKYNGLAENKCTFSEEILKLILNRMVKKEGIDLLYHARLYDAVKEKDVIKSIKLACIGGTAEFSADVFIDATGDGELAYISGCPCRLGRESDNLCQPMTLCFRLAGVDVEAFCKDEKRLSEVWRSYQAEGRIKNPRENLLTFKTLNDGVIHFNTTRIIKKNPTDPFDLTEAEIEGREQVFEIIDFLKENAESCKNATLISTAAYIGVRESRMIDGCYTLTSEDIINCVRFDDSIAAGNYDIDIHNPEGTGTYIYHFPAGKYYTIPYRSLLPKNADNLIVAGRCISTDHEAQASYRIMPTVCCIGQAAGSAAALCVKGNKNFRDVDVPRLQEILNADGAFIG